MMNQLLRCWDPLPAAEAVSGNHDLITDILLRLPVKSLLRFKCVSKEWLSLISDSRFCRHHRSLASAGIILCRTNGLIDHVTCGARNSCQQPFTSLSFINDSVGVKVLQSCNGLLLCSSFFELGKSRRYYICNPSTRQYLLLPHPNGCVESESTTILGVHLAFDPSKSPDYQVVCVRNYSASASPHDHYQIEIYSSERRSWRLSGSTFVAPFDMVFDNGVLWNGTIHWISPTGACLSFDIIQEQLGEMPSLPTNEKWSKRRLRYFNESGGHLHLIEVYGSSTTQFQVFVMNKDYSSWIPKYQVDLAAIVAAYPKMIRSYPDAQEIRFYVFSLLFVQENEENSLLLLHIPGTSISYNLRDKTFKKLFGFEENSTDANASLQIGCFHAHQFTETLASV